LGNVITRLVIMTPSSPSISAGSFSRRQGFIRTGSPWTGPLLPKPRSMWN
jgi:hypothetical protein